jgi:hypothetical protein
VSALPDGAVAAAQAVAWLTDAVVETALRRVVLPPSFPAAAGDYPRFTRVELWCHPAPGASRGVGRDDLKEGSA